MAQAAEGWLAALLRDAPANQELYRDPLHGFVLLAHAEYAASTGRHTIMAGAG